MNFVLDAFSSDLTQRALLGGLLAATTTALIGTWVVVRGLAFFGDALAHGVLPGIALAAIWGFDLTLGAIVSAVVMVGGINLVHRTTRLPEDTGIGLLFVGMLAVGVVIISRESTYAGDLTAFLFGDVLAVRAPELRLEAVALSITLVGVVVGHRAFLALACGRDKAAALGLRPGLLMPRCSACSPSPSSRRSAPSARCSCSACSSRRRPRRASIARRLPTIMATAVVIGWLSVVVGLTVSYHADTAASASVAGTAVAIFFVVLAVTELVRLLAPAGGTPAIAELTRQVAGRAGADHVEAVRRGRKPVPSTARSSAASRLRSICGETVKSSTRPHDVQIRWWWWPMRSSASS